MQDWALNQQGKNRARRINTNHINSIEIDNTQLENVTSFIYLGSVVNHSGGTQDDVKSRLAKAYTAFRMLRKIEKSKNITIKPNSGYLIAT